MVLNFPNTPEVGDEYKESNLIYEWDGEKWISKGGQGGQGNSEEIDEIIVTSTDTSCSFTAYNGTYPYLNTAVYVSKTEDFTELDLSYQTSFSDESITTVQYSGLDYAVTYFVKVSYTDKAGNRRFSEPVQFTSANIPDFAEYIVTQSSGTIDLSSYPQGARISIAYIAGGNSGVSGDGGWNGSESWNGNAGAGGGGGGFRFFNGDVRDMVGVPLSNLLNNGPGVTNLGNTGGGRGGKIYATGAEADGTDGGKLNTSEWGVLSEFKGYRFDTGNGGHRGVAQSPNKGGSQGGGGGGGGLRIFTDVGGYDGDNPRPGIPSIPTAQNGQGGYHNESNGRGGVGFGAGGGGGGGGNGGGGQGNGGSGVSGIALIKVWFRRDSLFTPADKFIPADPQEY